MALLGRMTKAEVAKRPEFQRLQQVSAECASLFALVFKAYEIDLSGYTTPDTLYAFTLEHATDVTNRRAALAKLTKEDQEALGL